MKILIAFSLTNITIAVYVWATSYGISSDDIKIWDKSSRYFSESEVILKNETQHHSSRLSEYYFMPDTTKRDVCRTCFGLLKRYSLEFDVYLDSCQKLSKEQIPDISRSVQKLIEKLDILCQKAALFSDSGSFCAQSDRWIWNIAYKPTAHDKLFWAALRLHISAIVIQAAEKIRFSCDRRCAPVSSYQNIYLFSPQKTANQGDTISLYIIGSCVKSGQNYKTYWLAEPYLKYFSSNGEALVEIPTDSMKPGKHSFSFKFKNQILADSNSSIPVSFEILP